MCDAMQLVLGQNMDLEWHILTPCEVRSFFGFLRRIWCTSHDIHANGRVVAFCQKINVFCFIYMVIPTVSGMLCCYYQDIKAHTSMQVC